MGLGDECPEQVTGEWHWSRDLKEEGNVLQRGQVLSRGTACAKALRQAHAWHVLGRARGLLPLSPHSLWWERVPGRKNGGESGLVGHCKRIAFHSEMSGVWYPRMSRSGLGIPWVLCCEETELGPGQRRRGQRGDHHPGPRRKWWQLQ